ncbi:MAG: hypothetical protein RLZZ282_1462 [Verrucomicrobiota bacterium]|jgi:anti-sigma B factor antagonist
MIVQSKIEQDGTGVLTVVTNSLTSVNAAEFRAVAEQVIAESAGRLVVDCEQLEFVDSSGVGAFLHAHNQLIGSRRPVCLSRVGAKVMASLELMQVHRIFDLEMNK